MRLLLLLLACMLPNLFESGRLNVEGSLNFLAGPSVPQPSSSDILLMCASIRTAGEEFMDCCIYKAVTLVRHGDNMACMPWGLPLQRSR